jgi:hypothetical protein
VAEPSQLVYIAVGGGLDPHPRELSSCQRVSAQRSTFKLLLTAHFIQLYYFRDSLELQSTYNIFRLIVPAAAGFGLSVIRKQVSVKGATY